MKPLPASVLLLAATFAACARDTPTAPAARAPAGPGFAVVFHADSVTASRKAFDGTATLSADGRHILLGGPVECLPAGQKAQFGIVVTQGATGARAEGSFTTTCSGQLQQWHATAHAVGPARFGAGAADACGALTQAFAQTAGRESWCRQIVLEP